MLPLVSFSFRVLLAGISLTGNGTCGSPVDISNGAVLSVMAAAGPSPVNVFDVVVSVERWTPTGWTEADRTAHYRLMSSDPELWREPIKLISASRLSPGLYRACLSSGQSIVSTSVVVLTSP